MKLPLSTSLVFYLSLLLDELPRTQAVRFPIHGRIAGFSSSDGGDVRRFNRLGARASIEGTPDITNSGNTMYKTNITLNGKQFNVLIDTGRYVRARATQLFLSRLAVLTSECAAIQFRLDGHWRRAECRGHWQDRWGHIRVRGYQRSSQNCYAEL